MPDGFQWEMYISREGEFDRFLWYSGSCDFQSEEGIWTFYKKPEEPMPFVKVEWHWESSTDTGDLKFTNIEPGSPENGGYIAYGVNDGFAYNVTTHSTTSTTKAMRTTPT